MDFAKGQIVLVDTNVIIEAHRVKSWRALADFFCFETVEKCVEETQTGFQNRKPEENIDSAALRATLGATYLISDLDDLSARLADSSLEALDAGERHLLIHASTRNDAWVVTSPDKAAMRYAWQKGWIERLVSLEALMNRVKARNASGLRDNFTEAWISRQRTALLLEKPPC